MLRLQIVQIKDRELLWNINQKYLYKMTGFYDDPMDENGNYHYGHFDDYFYFSLDVAKMILSKHPGKWEIKYNEKKRCTKKLSAFFEKEKTLNTRRKRKCLKRNV